MTNLAFPPIYLLSSHLSDEELHTWEEKIPSLTRDASEANFIVGKSRHIQNLVIFSGHTILHNTTLREGRFANPELNSFKQVTGAI